MEFHPQQSEYSTPGSLSEFFGGQENLEQIGSPWLLVQTLSGIEDELLEKAWIQLDGTGLAREDVEKFSRLCLTALPGVLLGSYPAAAVDEYKKVQPLVSTDASWSQVVPALAAAANSIPELEHVLAYDYGLGAGGEWLERCRQSLYLGEHGPLIAKEASAGFFTFLNSEGEEPDADFEGRVEEGVGIYLRDLARALLHPDARETAFLNIHAWVSQMAPSFEFDYAQWSFLVASIEQACYKNLGPGSALFLTDYLKSVGNILSDMDFVGSYLRDLKSVGLQLLSDEKFPYLEFAWEELVLYLLVDDVHQSASGEVSLLCRYIANHSQVLHGIDSQAFRTLGRLIVNASRDAMERHFLDRLEDSLDRVASSLEQSETWSKDEYAVRDVISSKVTSIGEALQIVEEEKTIEDDLYLLLKLSVDTVTYASNINKAMEEFNGVFISAFGSHRHTFWTAAGSLVTGVVTAFKKEPTHSKLQQGSTGLQVFSSLELLIAALEEQVGSLKRGAKSIRASAGDDALLECFVRRLALESSLAPGPKGARRVARWCSKFLPHQSVDKLGSFCKELVRSLPEAKFRGELRLFENWAPRLRLHRELWLNAEKIALVSANQVYHSMPEYADRTEGEKGLAKCARDSSFALRKLALSFSPEIEDPAEFFGASWRCLIDQYVHNRPSGLFTTTADTLIQATSEVLGDDVLSLVSQTLRPVYEEAENQSRAEQESFDFPAVKALLNRTSSEEEKESVSSLLRAAVKELNLPDFAGRQEAEEFLLKALPTSLSGFKADGHLGSRAHHQLRTLVSSLSLQNAAQVEVYFSELRQIVGASLDRIPEILALSLLQACLEQLRLLRLGRQIEEQQAHLAEQLSLRFVQALRQPLGEGPPDWARFEAVRLSLLELSSQSWNPSRRKNALQASLKWALNSLDPALAMELGVLLHIVECNLNDRGVLRFFQRLATTDGFLFSPTPSEEEQWRRLLSWSLLSGRLVEPELPSLASVVATLAICQDYDFTERLARAYQFLAETSGEEQAAPLDELRESFTRFLDGHEALVEEHDEAMDRVSKALEPLDFGLSGEQLVDIMKTRLVGAVTPDRLSLPTIPIFSGESWDKLQALSDRDFASLKELEVGPDLRCYWLECFDDLARLRSGLPELVQSWKSQNWIGRRQQLDVLVGKSGSFDWLRRELFPYWATQTPEELSVTVKKYVSDVILNHDCLSTRIAAIDLWRHVSSATLKSEKSLLESLIGQERLPSIEVREKALENAVSGVELLSRKFSCRAAESISIEQILGLNSRLQFERLKCYFGADPDGLKEGLEQEQSSTLETLKDVPAAEFFARWDLLERRADLVASVELSVSLSGQSTQATPLFDLWVHSISSTPEPSVMGQFLSQLPSDTTPSELSELRDSILGIETGNPRIVALLSRWSKRLERLEESLEFLSESTLDRYQRSLVVGMLCSVQDPSVAAAFRLDELLQNLRESSTEDVLSAYRSAHSRLQEVYLAHDLSGIEQEMKQREEVLSLLGGRVGWEKCLEELGERIWSLFPDRQSVSENEHRELLRSLPLIVAQPSRTPSYWQMPSVLVALGERILSALLAAGPQKSEKWQLAVLNAVGRSGLPRSSFEERFQHLGTALASNRKADAVLHSLEQTQPVTPSLLLSLKVASDLLKGKVDSHEASRWLVGATQRTCSLEPSTLVKSVKGTLLNWTLGAYPEELKESAKGIKLRLEASARSSGGMDQMLDHLARLSTKPDRELEQNRSWFSKISDSFEAVVRR